MSYLPARLYHRKLYKCKPFLRPQRAMSTAAEHDLSMSGYAEPFEDHLSEDGSDDEDAHMSPIHVDPVTRKLVHNAHFSQPGLIHMKLKSDKPIYLERLSLRVPKQPNLCESYVSVLLQKNGQVKMRSARPGVSLAVSTDSGAFDLGAASNNFVSLLGHDGQVLKLFEAPPTMRSYGQTPSTNLNHILLAAAASRGAVQGRPDLVMLQRRDFGRPIESILVKNHRAESGDIVRRQNDAFRYTLNDDYFVAPKDLIDEIVQGLREKVGEQEAEDLNGSELIIEYKGIGNHALSLQLIFDTSSPPGDALSDSGYEM